MIEMGFHSSEGWKFMNPRSIHRLPPLISTPSLGTKGRKSETRETSVKRPMFRLSQSSEIRDATIKAAIAPTMKIACLTAK